MLWLALATASILSAGFPAFGGPLSDPPEEPSEAPLPTSLMVGPNPGDELVQLRGKAWFARMSGHLEADGTTRGSRLSINSDVDMGGTVDIPEVEASVNVPYLGRFYAGWWRYNNSADATLDRTISFADHTFNVGTSIHTSLELNVAYLTYEYAFPKISIGVGQLELGLELGLRFLSGDATLTDAGETAESRGTLPALVLGGRAIYQILPWLRGEVEAVGIKISIDKESVSYVETYAEIVAQPLPWLFGGVGYKYMEMTYGYSARLKFDLDLQLSGVYLTVGVRF